MPRNSFPKNLLTTQSLFILVVLFILFTIPITSYVTTQQRDSRSSAAENESQSEESEINQKEAADLNKDGKVNVQDAAILFDKWGSDDPEADLNKNGIVDSFDSSIIYDNWSE